ncbi:MAG: CRISPR-associated endonuclease Cas3'', partial [Syntrophothermus sp.]
MRQLNEIYAKSINYGSLSLLEHTQHVTKAIEVFACNYNFDFNIELARKGAILHDLGKAHPHFQRKINNINGISLDKNRAWNFVHRHEISSLAFLPCFPENEWEVLIDMVIGHHKSIENDPSEKGILDLIEHDRDFIANHLIEWGEWSKYGFAVLQEFGLPVVQISSEKAKGTLEYVIDFCENKKNGWSPWRGLLMSADHFASAFMRTTDIKLKPLFRIPDYSFYYDERRKSSLYPLSEIPTDNDKPYTIVVAPTGAGKTDFLIRRCKGRLFYTLPFQASINAMWDRIKSDLAKKNPGLDIRLLHSTSRIVTNNNIDEQILQPLAGSSVKILTPHQLAAIIFGTSGFESVMLDLKGTDVILDEIHTYSDYSR